MRKNYTKTDITNHRFGRLVAIKRERVDKNYQQYWLCKCDCGNTAIVRLSSLNNGHTSSCGCLQKEKRTTHKMTKTTEYHIWNTMKARCLNPNSSAYQYYGGRGIKVCDRWKCSFENFYSDMGKRPSKEYSLDRIDVNGDYCPENCRWATIAEQNRNKSNNNLITIEGETLVSQDWSSEYGISRGTIIRRIQNGMSTKEEILTPRRYSAKYKRLLDKNTKYEVIDNELC